MVYNFECVLRGEALLFDLAFEVQLGSGRTNTKYLAFEDDRICVATVSRARSPCVNSPNDVYL